MIFNLSQKAVPLIIYNVVTHRTLPNDSTVFQLIKLPTNDPETIYLRKEIHYDENIKKKR